MPKIDAPSNTIIAGYYTDENYTNEWDPSGVPLDESLTVYVKLINATDVIINYEVGVGNGYVTNPQDSDDLIQSTYENFDYQIGSPKGSYAVSKDGYVFAGWYLDKDCTESVPSSSVIDNKITPAEDVWTSGYEVTYYAKFIKENCVIIRTIDSSTSDALKGAVFLLYKIDSGNTLYYSISESSVNWVSNSKVTLLSTDSSGNIEVSLTNGTYYLQETIAPTNYELYEDVITFTVNENGSVTVNQLDYVSANSNELIVQNNILKLLPSTDGLDRIVYIIVGLILCLGASVFFIKNTKKKDFG